MAFSIGLVVFPRMTQLDATGPYEVFSRMPGTVVHLLSPQAGPVRTEHGLSLHADLSFAEAPPLDLLCVPGGPGIDGLLASPSSLDFIAARGASARYVTSVCTGALVLGAAGLLRGYRATTHWLSLDLLERVGAIPVRERIVVDRNRITGGGVTAGIDFALAIAAEVVGQETSESIQLMIEYAPAPPFDAGSPDRVPAEAVSAIRNKRAPMQAERARLLDAALARRSSRL